MLSKPTNILCVLTGVMGDTDAHAYPLDKAPADIAACVLTDELGGAVYQHYTQTMSQGGMTAALYSDTGTDSEQSQFAIMDAVFLPPKLPNAGEDSHSPDGWIPNFTGADNTAGTYFVIVHAWAVQTNARFLVLRG